MSKCIIKNIEFNISYLICFCKYLYNINTYIKSISMFYLIVIYDSSIILFGSFQDLCLDI